MKKIKDKDLEEILNDENNFIVVSEKGAYICGEAYIIMSLFCFLVKRLNEDVPKEILDKNYEMAFKTQEELIKELFNLFPSKKDKEEK